MEYRNKHTGITINTNCKIAGNDWELVDKQNSANQQVTVKQENVTKPADQPDQTETDEIRDEELDAANAAGIEDVTVKEIKAELDALGVEYDPKAKKPALYALMMKHGK
ncbi:hypothetical protein [Lapidilactobacillus wuchangensis]|uniref:hypothetical protein n=1 Tax=Lapidilactobacillus wuchangensis TaxID=2486001 RepID=UPI000F77BAB9|nr:hypothetical protein [Lapidilactobacillus wuchangensis]